MTLYITHLYYMPAHHAHLFTHRPELRLTHCADYMPWTEIPLHGLASIEETEEWQASVPIYTHTLKATPRSQAELHPTKQYVYRLLTADGRSFLLGTHQRPYPRAGQTLTIPGRPSEPATLALTVTLSSTLPLMEIVIP